VVARVPFPVRSADELVAPIVAAATPRTRVALIDHVSSQTALVFPVERLVRELPCDVIVDGAHAPGMLPIDIAAIGAAYYVGNCHKWLCAPKGAGFLVARRDKHAGLAPTVISHGWNAPADKKTRFRLLHDWLGTDDPTAWLCVPDAIDWLAAQPGGVAAVMAKNHALAVTARRVLCDALAIPEPCPAELIGSMASIPIGDGDAEVINLHLYRDHRVEVPVFPWPEPPRCLLRVSAQLYNERGDYEALAAALTS
jgi:isopenicillin-N epimerase